MQENNRNPKEEKEETYKIETENGYIQRLFDTITNIVRELWLEKNTDRHKLAQGQL